MKRIFSRSKQVNAPQIGVVVKGFQVIYKRAQNKWATWMSGKTKHFSRRTWIVLLIFFLISGGGASIYIIVSSLTAKKKTQISITPIRKPKHITETGVSITTSTQLPEDEYNRIKKFRLYMDSLARSPGGKAIYDSITAQRPGLMDSVRFIENYYQ